MFFIKYAVVIHVAMCCQSLISDAWVHAYINVQHIGCIKKRGPLEINHIVKIFNAFQLHINYAKP
jgi:hypothetical protein